MGLAADGPGKHGQRRFKNGGGARGSRHVPRATAAPNNRHRLARPFSGHPCSPEASRLGPCCEPPPIMVAANSERAKQGGSAISLVRLMRREKRWIGL